MKTQRNSEELPVVLVIAATDGTGGAGLLADFKTLYASGCLPLSVATAVTAQTLNAVSDVWCVPPASVDKQLSVLSLPPTVIKVGVVGAAAAIVARYLDTVAPLVIWDPVLSPSGGCAFVADDDIPSLCCHLLRRAYLVTPNRQELLLMSGEKKVTAAVSSLLQQGSRHVLVTDIEGHGQAVHHALFATTAQTPVWEHRCRRRQGSYHGTGCHLSTQIAARLAHGDSLIEATDAAQQATLRAIDKALSLPLLGTQKLLHAPG